MRVTFLCQYFPPEMGAPAARTYEHARYWVENGHEVTVITGFPKHPTGVIHPNYRNDWVKSETVEGIELLRTRVYVTPNKGFTKRILNFLSFFASSLFFGAVMTKRPDVVVGTSPQFFCAVAAWLLSRIQRVPFVFEVRDIWPESAIELGVLKNRWLIRALETVELFLYRQAEVIIPVAESTKPYLIEKGVPAEKIRIVPNGIDAKYLALPSNSPEQVRAELGLQDKFIISYIGTHGISHALNVVLHAAAHLRQDTRFHFLFIGEGADKEQLERLAAELKLPNVTFMNAQPRERLLSFYRASDVSLVPLRRLPVFQKVLPSKIFELMGNGCPIICSVEGEAAALVERAQAGLCIEPENVDALLAAIQRLHADAQLRQQLGTNGKHFVTTHYLRSMLADSFLKALAEVGRGQRTPVSERPKTAEQQQPTISN
jgi:glycosyltransferase involved in cell wall biosynthesis